MSDLRNEYTPNKNSNQKEVWIFHGILVCVAIALVIFLFRNTSNYITEEIKPKIEKMKQVVLNLPGYQFSSSSLGKGYRKLDHQELNFQVDFPKKWKFYTTKIGNTANLAIHPKSSNQNYFNSKYLQVDILQVSRFKNIDTLQKLVKASVQNVHGVYHKRDLKFISKATMSKVFKGFESVEFSASWVSKNKKGRIYMRSFVLIDQGIKKSVTIRSANQKDLHMKKIEKLLSTLKMKQSLAH